MESAFSSAFEMLTHYVAAAQRTGELMGGDPTRIASLLLCVAIGGMQRMREPVGRHDEEALPVVVLHLLALRRSDSDQSAVDERIIDRQRETPSSTDSDAPGRPGAPTSGSAGFRSMSFAKMNDRRTLQ
jgi:hypothetical protein